MKEFKIEQQTSGDVEILRISGSLDMYSFPRLESQLQTAFQQGHYRLLIDCGNLEYVGSAGLGALIGFTKQAREHNGDVKLLNVPERIVKIIELLGFTKVLKLYNNEPEALASFTAA